jgi:hypothetical protein
MPPRMLPIVIELNVAHWSGRQAARRAAPCAAYPIESKT